MRFSVGIFQLQSLLLCKSWELKDLKCLVQSRVGLGAKKPSRSSPETSFIHHCFSGRSRISTHKLYLYPRAISSSAYSYAAQWGKILQKQGLDHFPNSTHHWPAPVLLDLGEKVGDWWSLWEGDWGHLLIPPSFQTCSALTQLARKWTKWECHLRP